MGRYCKCKLTFCVGLLWAAAWVGRSESAGSWRRHRRCFARPHGVSRCVTVPRAIHLRLISFYLSHTVAATNPYFFILRSYWSWGLEVWDLMSFISEPSPAAAFFFFFFPRPPTQSNITFSFRCRFSRLQHLNSRCSCAGIGSFIIGGSLVRFSCMILKTECEEKGKKRKTQRGLFTCQAH